MIRCRLHHLEARCRERGYTLDEVRPCIVAQEGDSLTVDETHPAYPRERKAGFVPPRIATTPGVSFLDKVRNFTQAAVGHIAAGMPTASDAEIERRYAICQGCEFFKGGSCGKCGCPINRDRKFVSKLAWADQSCPAGKWGAVSS